MKTIKMILVLMVCSILTVSIHAKEVTNGYSEIAEIKINITEDIFSSYNRFNPIFKGEIASIASYGWKFGYIDLTGKQIIAEDYNLAYDFLGDYAAVDKSWLPGNNNRSYAEFGLIDRNGKEILPLEYVHILQHNGNYFNEYGFAIVSKYDENYEEVYGAVDRDNNIIIPLEYDQIEQFIDGKAQAVKDGEPILLDIYGNETEIISNEKKYEIVTAWNNDTNTYKYGLIDDEQNIILPYEYNNINYWKDSLYIAIKASINSSVNYVIDASNGKIIAESSDSILLDTSYDEESDLLILNRGTARWIDEKSAKYGAINLTTGKTVIPFEYNYLDGINNDLIAAVKNGKIGFIDKENNIVVPFVHEGIFVYGAKLYNDKAIIFNEEYDMIIDKNNNIIYKTEIYNLSFNDELIKYDYIIFYKRGELNNSGLMDITGKIIIPMKYYYDMEVIADKYILCYEHIDGVQYSIFDLKGNKISKDYYSSVVYLEKHDSFLVYANDSLNGIINNKGEYILPKEYKFYDSIIGDYAKEIIVVQNNNTKKYGYINSSGEIIVPVIFDYACSVSGEGYAIVQLNGKWKIIRINEGIPSIKNGDILGDVLYSDIVAYIDDKAIPSNIVNNKTLIVAEDLANYGFIVIWDNSSRTLRIQRDINAVIKPLKIEKDTTYKSGTFKCNYLYSDIKTYLSGEEVECYSIGGRILIEFDLLARYGDITWNAQTREIRLISENNG